MAYGGPRLYRFYNYEQVHYIPAPVAGWNPDANPWEIPLNQAVLLDNFVIRPGSIAMRGPVDATVDLSIGGLPFCLAGWVLGESTSASANQTQVLLIPKSVAGGKIDHWNAPLLKPTAQASLGVPGNNQFLSTNGGQSFSSAPITADAPGPRSVRFGSKVYGLNYASSAAAITDVSGNYVVWPVQMWLSDAYSVGPFASRVLSTVAPKGGFDIAQYLNRIWILGGQDVPGAGTTFDPNALFFTNPIAPGGGNVTADWQDPISGLTNKIDVDADDSDYGVGLARVRNGLVIFKRNSVWILRGTTSTSFALKLVSKEMGCLDARSIIEADGGAYFVSHRGLMFTDGVNVRNMTGPLTFLLQRALRDLVWAMVGTNGSTQTYITSAMSSSGHIVLSMGEIEMTINGGLRPMLTAIFDPQSGAWSRLTSKVWNADYIALPFLTSYPGFVFGSQSKRQMYTLGDRYFTRLEDPTRGISITTPGANTSLHDNLRVVSPAFLSIPAQWVTGYVPLTVQRKQGQAKRFFCDYLFAAVNLTPTTGWSVQPVDATGSSVGSSMNVDVAPPPSYGGPLGAIIPVTSTAIQHKNQDFTNEITDLGFVVSWSDTGRTVATDSAIAELFGVGVEFQRTRDLRP